MNIAIAGRKGAGKDTAADCIMYEFPNLTKLSLSKPIKEIVSKLFNISTFELDDLYVKEKVTKLRFGPYKTIKCIKLLNELNQETYKKDLSLITKLTLFCNLIFKGVKSYREMLQFIGTSLCRKLINENLFTDNLSIKIKQYNDKKQYVIISDVRFNNELQCLLNHGFFTILVKRIIPEMLDTHESENSLPPDHEFDFIIYNNGPMEDYFNSIYNILAIIKDVDGKYTI
jgi:hypothetical protein